MSLEIAGISGDSKYFINTEDVKASIGDHEGDKFLEWSSGI